MARNLLIILAFMLTSTIAMAQTSLKGSVTDADNGEPILFGNVALFRDGTLITGVETDFDGNYNITNIDPGTYDVEASYVGYSPQRIEGVVLYADKANNLDIQLGVGINLTEVVVVEYVVPLIEQDNTTQGGIVTAEQIKTLPTKNINGLAANTAGIGSSDDGADLTVRGSRAESTDYYVDGIRVRANNLPPQSEIEQLQVITGGVAAQYGDVTGGVISITSKGPSSEFRGGIEAETSEYLDAFGYNLLSANVSGPIIKKKDANGDATGETILGFRFSGQYLDLQDDDPPALPVYQVTGEKLAELEANPVVQVNDGFLPAAEFVTNEDIEVLNANPNERSTDLNLTAKFDARLSDAIDITLSGSYINNENQFTPGNYTTDGNFNRVFNNHNNPTDINTRYRGNFRFRHRLGGAKVAGEEETQSVIRNASYILQFGYERNLNERSDQRHGNDYFAYGHVGTFNREWTPVVGIIGAESLRNRYQQEEENNPGYVDTLLSNLINEGQITEVFNEFTESIDTVGHTDYAETFTGVDFSNSSNPVLANYNNVIGEDTDATFNDYLVVNGEFRNNVESIWDLHNNVGRVYDFARKQDNDYYTFNVNSSFDLVPGGSSEKGRHSVQFGILYEQRFIRSHSLNPVELWLLARSLSNAHLTSTNPLSPNGSFPITDPSQLETVIQNVYFDQLQGQELGSFSADTNLGTEDFQNSTFLRKVREATGQSLTEFVNVDALDPSQLSLDMFSARELVNDTGIDLEYTGYDYLGNKLANDVTFDDFFTARNEEGIRTLPVAAFAPIYSAAYIQDKFQYKDIIFRLGLRVDRYDANTKVLKDEFSLYEIMNANDFYAQYDAGDRPSTIGDDYKVYVDGGSGNNRTVRAFRDDEQWYFANGEQANDGNLIFGQNGLITPQLYEERNNNIQSEDFDPNNSFEDYAPQINWMPRLAFSFPISDEANFYANYDILVQRPGSGQARGTALDYFFIADRAASTLYRNPGLKPQRTITYEVGFKQKLSNTSALNVSAYYRELRDMIQRRTYLQVAGIPAGTYTSYDNQDFGTVKAFSFQYDMRRTNNLQLNASYTLQFADGTGSDADSQAGLSDRGNIRTLFPLDFDERHRLNVIADYRYGSGKRYNGPRVAGRDIFANAGLNIQATAVSGRPYTVNNLPDELGGTSIGGALNGARKPWNYWVNLRLDKNFTLSKPDAKRELNLNVYFRVQNLFDVRNVIEVYSATGSPEDDGYLTSANGLDAIQDLVRSETRSLEAFQDAYNWAMLNPDFYSIPRRMYVGAIFDF